MKRQHCERCNQFCEHYRDSDGALSGTNPILRVCEALLSFGASELMRDRYLVCARCGYRTKT